MFTTEIRIQLSMQLILNFSISEYKLMKQVKAQRCRLKEFKGNCYLCGFCIFFCIFLCVKIQLNLFKFRVLPGCRKVAQGSCTSNGPCCFSLHQSFLYYISHTRSQVENTWGQKTANCREQAIAGDKELPASSPELGFYRT